MNTTFASLVALLMIATPAFIMLVRRFVLDRPWQSRYWREGDKLLFGIMLALLGTVVGTTANLFFLLGWTDVPFVHSPIAPLNMGLIALGYLIHLRTITVRQYGLTPTVAVAACAAITWGVLLLFS